MGLRSQQSLRDQIRLHCTTRGGYYAKSMRCARTLFQLGENSQPENLVGLKLKLSLDMENAICRNEIAFKAT
jgi:hypothetical protein